LADRRNGAESPPPQVLIEFGAALEAAPSLWTVWSI
jgi:hypothetical protein